MSLGTYVVDEKVFPIVGVSMRAGLLFFLAKVDNVSAFTIRDGSEYRIHGEDGSLIFTGVFRTGEDFIVGEDLDTAMIVQPMRLSPNAEDGWPEELVIRVAGNGDQT